MKSKPPATIRDGVAQTDTNGAQAGHRKTILLILIALSLANTWLFVAFRYVPFGDYPSHLLKANIIRHYQDPSLDYAEHFTINKIPTPNILNDYVTAAVSTVLPIHIAGKLVVALAVFGLPLAVWFWIDSVADGKGHWALWALWGYGRRFFLKET